MKIVSVNPKHTQSENLVAFNVDNFLAPDVMEHCQFGNLLKVYFSNRILYVESPDEQYPIGSSTVRMLNEQFALAEVAHTTALDNEARHRAQMLKSVAANTGVPMPEQIGLSLI